MLVTEEEAKQKMCPVRTVRDHANATLGCAGARCAAWRWHAWTEYVRDELDGVNFRADVRTSSTHGYCGLGGRVLGIADPTNPPPEENQ